MNRKSRFKEVMRRLGENDSVDDDLCRTLGEFFCIMYGGGHAKDVNTLQFNKFTEKQKRENKYVDLSALPPCQATLKLHILRANRVAYLMKRSSVAHCQIALGIMKEESFGLRKRIPVLSRDCWLTAITLMKVTKRTLMTILKMIV